MIKITGSGWATFEYGDFRGLCSYITDVPIDLLEGCITFLRTLNLTTVRFDEEGSEFYLCIGDRKSVIIAERDTTEVYVIDMDAETLTEQLVADMEADGVSAWAAFLASDEQEDKEYEKKIRALMEEAKSEAAAQKKFRANLKELEAVSDRLDELFGDKGPSSSEHIIPFCGAEE